VSLIIWIETTVDFYNPGLVGYALSGLNAKIIGANRPRSTRMTHSNKGAKHNNPDCYEAQMWLGQHKTTKSPEVTIHRLQRSGGLDPVNINH